MEVEGTDREADILHNNNKSHNSGESCGGDTSSGRLVPLFVSIAVIVIVTMPESVLAVLIPVTVVVPWDRAPKSEPNSVSVVDRETEALRAAPAPPPSLNEEERALPPLNES